MFSRMFIRIIYIHVKCPNRFSVRMFQDGYEVMFTLLYFNLTTLMSLHAAEHQNLISEALRFHLDSEDLSHHLGGLYSTSSESKS